MLSKLDEAKTELIARAVEVAAHGRSPEAMANGALGTLLRRYYRHVAPEEVLGTDPVDVYGAAISHYGLAGQRAPGTASVRVYTPTVEEHGWSSGHTVVDVVTDDMPFLVDSVTAELNRQDLAIHVVVHPQLVVHRDAAGNLVEVCDAGDCGSAGEGAIAESWMHIEIDRDSDRARLDALETDLERVLGDVRSVVSDWQAMRAAALNLADALSVEAPPVEAEECAEAQELLRWLADDHFTFLGYREYDLTGTEPGAEALLAVEGTGLGILHGDRPVSVSFAQASKESRAKAREASLLVLTKANSKATVHKPSYLDYVGIKRFDSAGNVVGERRFLGLFSSAAYTERVTRIPVVRRKVSEVLAAAGFEPNSHDGRDLLEILETYPRDELFQVSTAELAPIALSVLYLQERRRLRLFLRRDAYGRFLSALVYLPRDRFNTEIRQRMQDILLRELGGASIDFTLRST